MNYMGKKNWQRALLLALVIQPLVAMDETALNALFSIPATVDVPVMPENYLQKAHSTQLTALQNRLLELEKKIANATQADERRTLEQQKMCAEYALTVFKYPGLEKHQSSRINRLKK